MARFHINYVADCVKDAMDLYVIIPQRKHVRSAESSKLELGSFRAEYPLLLLLHDEASSPLELLSMTRLERFAEEYGVMVALPQGLLSWYTDYADRDSGSNSAWRLCGIFTVPSPRWAPGIKPTSAALVWVVSALSSWL